ncbi:DUF2255 family protein [Streptomyces sp. NBC_01190]|uniref:DUF2255 family protein n=1 Tax=Streptomyces sp. NBC_01190 TaxID=2903767 RepID=UPI00386446AC|nr:DUF2255 family protein [Streptomyces sp. NBC_01190]
MTAIDYFANTETVRIVTERADGGEVVTPIWSVVVDGVPYIRSAYGPDSKWYRRVQRAGRALFDGDERYLVTIDNVDDETTVGKVDDAYRAKFAGSPYLSDLLAPEIRALTMRLTPR